MRTFAQNLELIIEALERLDNAAGPEFYHYNDQLSDAMNESAEDFLSLVKWAQLARKVAEDGSLLAQAYDRIFKTIKE